MILAAAAAGCAAGAGADQEITTKKAALSTGNCAVPNDYANATFFGHKTMAGNTSSATAGDSLLPANNVTLGTYPAGTTIIVGFTGLYQNNLSGDTFIRLFDDFGQVAYGDDACGSYGSRVVYTVPQGTRTLTVRVGCYASQTCGGDLYAYSRLDSNGQLTDVVAAHGAIITGSDYSGQPGPNGSTYGGTSVRQLADPYDTSPHLHLNLDPAQDRVAPVQDGSHGYIDSGTFVSYSHFEGVQRLRHAPNFIAAAGAFRADVMFGYTGNGGGTITADKSWLQAGATNDGSLRFRYSNYDLPAPGLDVTQFNHFGGIQTAGRYIVGGVSNYPNHDPPWGRILLLDASSPANVGIYSTMRKWLLDPEVMSGCTKGIGPSQVGITKLQNGAFLMAVSRYSQQNFDFYMKDIDEGSTILTPSYSYAGFADIEDGTFNTPTTTNPDPRGWTVQNGTSGATGGIDNDSIALVTQTNGDVYLLATKWVTPFSKSWVQQVLLMPNGTPKYTASLGDVRGTNLGYQCTGNSVACNFTGAAGFYINSFDDSLYLYSMNQFLNNNSPPTEGVSEFVSDLAHGRTIYPSSSNATYPMSNLVNGDQTDIAMTNTETTPWAFVDLGAVKTVTGVKVVPCVSYYSCNMLTNYSIWTWNGSNWVLQFNHPGQMFPGVSDDWTLPSPVQTEYVLLQVNSGTTAINISELQVY
jgi:hypothetical protein